MAEEQKARIEEAMEKMVEDVDKSYMRNIQRRMFKCAAACCEDKKSPTLDVQQCIKDCAIPLENAQNLINGEFTRLQDRLQRCIMTCNDTIRQKVETSTSDVSRYTGEFEGCAKQCVDSHISLIPDVLNTIKELMKKERY